MTACRSCGAPIVWAIAAGSSRRIPLDADPTDDGNLIVVRHRWDGPDRTIPIVHVVDEDAGTDGLRFRSHFATCPDAKSWRRS